MNLSITIIGHNEVDHLRELLPQLKWATEIIYVDCESQDGSLNVAREHGCRVFSRPNNTNLNVNKSYALEQATGDWVFYVDPDERLPELLVKEIEALLENTGNSAFRLNRRNHYFGNWLRHGSQYPDTQLRLFRRNSAHFPNKHVHEKLVVDGSSGKLNNDMLHYPYLNISQFLSKFDFYTGVEAGYLSDSGVKITTVNTLRFLVLKPFFRFLRRYLLKGGFRDGYPGLFCAIFDALNIVVRYFKLWEMSRTTSTVSKSQRSEN
ncbi:MAG: glycosyltransferase family 2 protein [SAR324 cluster bacterium]|nr:glycosyltransferase family 2 protein [SAR324 cluster bacterium]MBL7034387.1 glycosyltransferase family 2 protein [SAR324 cluster bacterium]